MENILILDDIFLEGWKIMKDIFLKNGKYIFKVAEENNINSFYHQQFQY